MKDYGIFQHLIRVMPAEGRANLQVDFIILWVVAHTMGIQQWLQLLIKQLKETGLIQWLAVLSGVAEVFLAKANKIWLYPAGIVSVILSVWVLLQAGLYAECLLNLYYLLMSIYGWWYWIKKKSQPAIKIARSNSSEWIITLLIATVGTFFLYFILKNFTPSSVPLWDAFVSATAWAGMWLLAKRKIENWIWLNISNVFAVPLLLKKELPLYAALTVFLFIIAVLGYIQWNKILQREKQLQPAL